MKVALTFVIIAALYLLPQVKLDSQEPLPSSIEAPVLPANLTKIKSESKSKGKRAADENKSQEKGLCECAVFETETPDTEAKPLISKSLVNVTCDDSGKTQCKDFCVALARASREQGGETLCAAVNHAVNLKPSVFTKVCNVGDYVFSGVTSPQGYCCHENLPVQCQEAAAN